MMLAPIAVNPPGPSQLNPTPGLGELAVNVAVPPIHVDWTAGAIEQVGFGLTTSVAVQVPTPPLASVTVDV